MSDQPKREHRLWTALLATLILLAAPALLIYVMIRGGEHGGDHNSTSAETSGLGPDVADPGMEHVHGLGVDPGDGTLHAATHFGVFSVDGDGTATRVGNAQDTMGFTITGPRTFLASGHPDFAEDDERLMGLIESTDAGRSWKALSLRGEADFHALKAAHGRVYGYDATSSAFKVSEDRRTWERRSSLALRDFAVSPSNSEAVVATTEQGPARSVDGGRTWQGIRGAPALVVVAWPREDVLYGVDIDGVVHRSVDGGKSWGARASVGGVPEALTVDPDQPESVYVAVNERGIVASVDGGLTFTDRYRQ